MNKQQITFIFALILLFLHAPADAKKYLPDDPLWIDPDEMDSPQPDKANISQLYDFVENSFSDPAGKDVRSASNINTIGEVPDSSWFVNRIGLHDMSTEELIRGPSQMDGPDLSKPWVITSAKSEGISPGFRIQDARGDTYFIKFDPPKYPQLATSAEAISSRFFHAFGYNVPAYSVVFVTRDQLVVDPEAKISETGGKKRPMTAKDVDQLLELVAKLPDGRIPVSASPRLPGTDLSKFKYYGTRSDDANDIFPHQDRRELRGLRVFSAWLNHDDSRSVNTMNMYVTEGERHFVRHYLIDFGSTLGSGSVTIQSHRAGNEYIIEAQPSLKSGLTFGLWDRPWRRVKYPDYPAVGRYEADYFRPERWKPEYPNAAFDKMQNVDAFWASKIIHRFTNEMIKAIVHSGQIMDPQAEDYLARTIQERKDKILRYYFSRLNPLDAFEINSSGQSLNFRNLGVEIGLSKQTAYEYQWFTFDNEKETATPVGELLSTSEPSLPLPQYESDYLMVRIRTRSQDQPDWAKSVSVYLRSHPERTVVGIERED